MGVYLRFRLFNWVELPFALFCLFVLVASIYLTFNSFFIGLFIPPIVAIFIAGGIIRWVNPRHNGFWFVYHSLALAGVFLIIFSFFMYKLLAPIFSLVYTQSFSGYDLDKFPPSLSDNDLGSSQVPTSGIYLSPPMTAPKTKPTTLEGIYECIVCGQNVAVVEDACGFKFIRVGGDGLTGIFVYGNYTSAIPEKKYLDFYVSVITDGQSELISDKKVYQGWKPIEQRIIGGCGVSISSNLHAQEPTSEPTPIPELDVAPEVASSVIVEGSKTDVTIKNNLDRAISVSVTYRVSSSWFNVNYQENKVFDIGANTQQAFKVYNNDGCNSAPCSVSILNYTY